MSLNPQMKFAASFVKLQLSYGQFSSTRRPFCTNREDPRNGKKPIGTYFRGYAS